MRRRGALAVMGDRSALLQHIFADGEADALLLLVADQRQVGVEEIVRGVALACCESFTTSTSMSGKA